MDKKTREKFIRDYIDEANLRIEHSEKAFSKKSYNYIIRECQDSAELLSKALLFKFNFVVPKSHDLSKHIEEIKELFSEDFQNELKWITKLLRDLRKNREIAFYGDEDLEIAPSELFSEKDARIYFKKTKEFYNLVKKELT